MLSVPWQRLFRKEYMQGALVISKVACGLLCLLLVGLLVWGVLRYAVSVSTEAQALRNEIQTLSLKSAATGPANPASKIDYSQIAAKSLLGALGTPTPAPSARPTPKPSNSKLALMGVFLTDGEAPYVIIEDQKKNLQDAFVLNEMVFGEAKLTKILIDRVEIDRNGQKETLVIDDLPSRSSGPATAVASGAGDGGTITVAEQEVDKALENLPLLLTQARAVPYFKDGKAVGLRLFAIKSDSLYEKIGLKNADILKTVNGNSLGDLSQALKLFEQLKSERSLSLVLERNGEEKEYKYEIR